MHKDAQYWLNLAQYDIQTAEAMLKYLYVLFTCQQAVEKTLKAAIVQKTKKLPPRIHDLQRLTQTAELTLDEEQTDFLNQLSYFYLETRYPEEMNYLSREVNEKKAADYLRKSKVILEWLGTKLI